MDYYKEFLSQEQAEDYILKNRPQNMKFMIQFVIDRGVYSISEYNGETETEINDLYYECGIDVKKIV